MSDLISMLSDIRSNYNCMDEKEEPYYRALSEAIQLASAEPERKKGKWKMVLTQDPIGFNTVCFRCSECNGMEYSTSPFCRMCGANMEEGD